MRFSVDTPCCLIDLPAPPRQPRIQHLLRVWDGRCAYCGKAIAAKVAESDPGFATRDHFVPRRRRGGDSLKNLLPACKGCNGIKGSIDPRYFLMLWLRLDPVGFFKTMQAVMRFERQARRRKPALDVLYPQTPANEP